MMITTEIDVGHVRAEDERAARYHLAEPVQSWRREYVLRLSEYEFVNLRAALEAVARDSSPLSVLNTGDWIGEILNAIDGVDRSEGMRPVKPNRTPEESAKAARDWKST